MKFTILGYHILVNRVNKKDPFDQLLSKDMTRVKTLVTQYVRDSLKGGVDAKTGGEKPNDNLYWNERFITYSVSRIISSYRRLRHTIPSEVNPNWMDLKFGNDLAVEYDTNFPKEVYYIQKGRLLSVFYPISIEASMKKTKEPFNPLPIAIAKNISKILMVAIFMPFYMFDLFFDDREKFSLFMDKFPLNGLRTELFPKIDAALLSDSLDSSITHTPHKKIRKKF